MEEKSLYDPTYTEMTESYTTVTSKEMFPFNYYEFTYLRHEYGEYVKRKVE